ncbi:hypothetical protein Tco_1546463 [Tanacetum coccineum]
MKVFPLSLADDAKEWWISKEITTREELVEKFFCRFYPESYDGEDEMLDEGENWGIDPLEFLSNINTSFKYHKKMDGRTQKVIFHAWMNGNWNKRYVDNSISSSNELKESKYENPSNTTIDSFFKAYEVRDIEKQSQTKRKYTNTSNSIKELPNKRRYVVPTGRYKVPAGKVIIIVSTGRLSLVPTGRQLSPGSDNDSDDASIHSEATIPQQQRNNQPQYITTISNNNAKFPYLKKDDLKRTGRDCDGRVIILPPTTADEHIVVQRESKARNTLLQSIPDDHVADFHYIDDARDIWNAVKARISEAEGLHKGYDRMQKILSQLNQLKAKPEDEDINLKFLRALPSSWSQVALTLKTKGGLEFLSFDDLYYKLKTLETVQVILHLPTLFHLTLKLGLKDLIEKLDLEEMDLKWQMAMLFVRVHKFEAKAETD